MANTTFQSKRLSEALPLHSGLKLAVEQPTKRSEVFSLNHSSFKSPL